MRLLLSAAALGALAFFLSRRRNKNAAQDQEPSFNASGATSGGASAPSQAGAAVADGAQAAAGTAAQAAHDVVAQAQDVATAVGGQADAPPEAAGAAGADAQSAADHVQKATGQVKETAGSIAEQIKSVASDVAGEVAETAGSITGKVQDAAGSIGSQVKDASGPVAQEATAAASASVAQAKDAAPGVVDQVKSAASTVVDKATDAAGTAGGKVQETANTAGDAVQNTASTARDSAEDTASMFGDKMRDIRGDQDEILASPSSSTVATDVDTPAPSMRETMHAELVDIEQKVDTMREAMSGPVEPAEASPQAAGMSGIMDTEIIANRPDAADGPGIPPQTDAHATAAMGVSGVSVEEQGTAAGASTADALPTETVTVDGREETIPIPAGAATAVPGGGTVDPLSDVPLGSENASSEVGAGSPTTGMEHPPVVDRMGEIAGRTSGAFVGNKATRAYRPSDSPHLPGEAKRIYFESEAEAKAAGFLPAESE